MKRKFISALMCICLVFNIILVSNAFSITARAEESNDTPSDGESVCSASDTGSYLHLSSSVRHFSPNSDISVTYSLTSESYIIDTIHAQKGVMVNSISTDADGKLVTVVLSPIQGYANAKFDLCATLDSGEVVYEDLFIINTNYGHFISAVSEDDAYERYFDNLINSGIATTEEVADMRSERNRSSVMVVSEVIPPSEIATNSLARGAVDTYVTGWVAWNDNINLEHTGSGRVRGVKIEFYDKKNIGSVCIGTTYTDSNGNYSFGFENADDFLDFDNGGYDIFMRIYPGDNNVMVNIGSSTNNPYYYESSIWEDVETGSTHSLYVTMTHTSDMGKSFQISQAVMTARDYAKAMMGTTPQAVSVSYPCENSSAEYDFENKQIRLSEVGTISSVPVYGYNSWDVIMHEYGHHMQCQIDIIAPLGDDYPEEHYINVNAADEYGGKEIGVKLAWSEAWPTVFGMLAQNYYSSRLVSVPFTNDGIYTSNTFTFHYPIETSIVAKGEACEGTVAAVLWDMFDSSADINDDVSMSHSAFWRLTTAYGAKTFSDCIATFYSLYPTQARWLGRNLSYYEIATSVPTLTNASSVSTTVPPTFSWQPQGGRASTGNNNRFQVIIYNAMGEELVRGAVTYSTTYTLTASEWQQIQNLAITAYSVCVSAMQTDAPVTGEYISGDLYCELP